MDRQTDRQIKKHNFFVTRELHGFTKWSSIELILLTLKENRGVPPAALMNYFSAVEYEVMIFKPSCNYHFWCLQQVKNKNFVGCIRNLKNFAFENCFSCKN